ncbi:Vacuolar fusion protein mon1 [Coemansia thaxteri]|uniref:Vacuolar fusion protein MON1 n=1 Tax=Coemansia thaxteri TaxID=2663907 RepID=A0A9W8BQ23_9FUNG|nr:Vacuolar fusion protein mon1 [Coemansia thaxteri]KAJ2008201.1 Vacuolar fusion protein mon1 [Coemansia thaxteri]KAJ2470390.1 Vacuolar fusion protein mon1 [Coemansia sp. RSA 2322]KAJ2487424.1 Vacuolar fusion protein mon1 [Coemansia sp. RSA 2320]
MDNGTGCTSSASGTEPRTDIGELGAEKLEDFCSPEWRQRSRHFLVLSSAGKPIYSRFGNEAQLSTLMSAVQAIISTFADMSDPVRSMAVGAHTIVFYTNGPLYLLAASDRGDPPELLRNELQLLHSQIVSILTSAQLTKIFEQRSNFDLRQLLGGTEVIIDHLVDKLDTDLSFALGSLDTLWIRYKLRERVGKVLLSARPTKGLLYAMLVADMKLVTLLRPRKHSLHPSDLHLLFNMATSRSFLTGEHWMPMCFPRFNDQGFLHAYLNYISPNVALILVSADRDSFAAMTQCRERICEDLAVDDSLQRLDDAASQRALHPSELGVSGLLQLYYRNKTLVQHFGTRFDVSVAEDQKGRIINTYKRLRLYMAGGSSNPLRIIYYKREEDTVLAWQSSSFELYATVAPAMEVKAMIRLVNSVLEWIKNEEDHLFVINAPSY